MDYEDFELQIGPRSGDGYLVRVLRSPAGQADGLLELPEAAADLGPKPGVARDARPRRAETSAARHRLVEVGSGLFRTLFTGQVGNVFHQSLRGIGGDATGCGLRICLRINPRDRTLAPLHQVPWELLYREDTEDFLALSRQTPVLRSLDIPRPLARPPLSPPLRILIVLSQDPQGDALQLGQELAQLGVVLGQKPGIEVEVLDDPDSSTLRRTLSRAPFHVLHYMGHGGFDPRSGDGALLFPGSHGTRVEISGRHLATKLKDLDSLRLVVLNACDTARSSADAGHSPFAGVAAALVLGGIPAVVAMQSPIADPHAIAFSVAFYEQLANGRPLEESVAEGRQAIHSSDPEGACWAVPVLFMRTPSQNLFAHPEDPAPPAKGEERPPVSRVRRAAGALLLAVILASASAVITRFVPLSCFGGSEEDPLSPVSGNLPSRPETTERTDGPATGSSRQTVTVGEGAGAVRFEISADRSAPVGFAAALRRAAAPLVDPDLAAEYGDLAGRTIRLEVAAPRLSNFTQAGLHQQSCRLAATCNVAGKGRTVDLGPIDAARTHVDGAKACAAAAEALAEAVVRKLAQHLQEEST